MVSLGFPFFVVFQSLLGLITQTTSCPFPLSRVELIYSGEDVFTTHRILLQNKGSTAQKTRKLTRKEGVGTTLASMCFLTPHPTCLNDSLTPCCPEALHLAPTRHGLTTFNTFWHLSLATILFGVNRISCTLMLTLTQVVNKSFGRGAVSLSCFFSLMFAG